MGVKPGQLVAFYLQNSPEFLIAWIALWSIGCAPAMLNYNLAGDALLHCLKISESPLMLVDDDPKCAARVEEQRSTFENDLGMKIVSLDDALKSHIKSTFPTKVPDDKNRRGMAGSFPIALAYTSGTTGMPKGCAFTIERVQSTVGRGKLFNEKRGLGGDRWYICMPMYHGTGGMASVACILEGIGVAVGKRFSVSNFWKDIHDSQSTFFVYVGETARYLLNAPPSPLDKGHKVRCMYGNGLRPDVWDRFRERFDVPEVAEFFNSTEGLFALLNYDRGPYLSSCVGHHGALLRAMLHKTFVPVAIDPSTGDIFRDPKTGFATRNSYSEGGEMIVKIPSESAFQGYWRNEESTAKKFLHDVFVKGDLYYRSGDALRRTDDGRWYFLDRLGDTFRWKSENVSTAEVAQAIGTFPGVTEANVYGVLVPGHDGRAGCMALQIDPERKQAFNFNELLKHARERLPKYAVPVFVRVVQSSSHIHNNKQNKVPLREEGVDPALVGSKVEGGEKDRFLWLSEEGYVDFGMGDWQGLVERRILL